MCRSHITWDKDGEMIIMNSALISLDATLSASYFFTHLKWKANLALTDMLTEKTIYLALQ